MGRISGVREVRGRGRGSRWRKGDQPHLQKQTRGSGLSISFRTRLALRRWNHSVATSAGPVCLFNRQPLPGLRCCHGASHRLNRSSHTVLWQRLSRNKRNVRQKVQRMCVSEVRYQGPDTHTQLAISIVFAGRALKCMYHSGVQSKLRSLPIRISRIEFRIPALLFFAVRVALTLHI